MNELLETCLVIVQTMPQPLCFYFFLIVLPATFFPFFKNEVLHTARDLIILFNAFKASFGTMWPPLYSRKLLPQ